MTPEDKRDRGGRASAMKRHGPLLVFLIFVISGGLVIGSVTSPGEWYAGLAKPAFNPPNWIFAPVWTVLYVLIAIAGWRIWKREPGSGAMGLWWAQMVLNFIWSPIFFAAHQTGLALIVIIVLLAAILGFIVASWRLDRPSALLFTPYAAWVAFASVLNASIYALN